MHAHVCNTLRIAVHISHFCNDVGILSRTGHCKLLDDLKGQGMTLAERDEDVGCVALALTMPVPWAHKADVAPC